MRQRLVHCGQNGYFAAEVYAWLGEREKAIESLEHACEQHNFYMIFAAVEPAFRFLHGDPRFQKICARVGLPAPAAQ